MKHSVAIVIIVFLLHVDPLVTFYKMNRNMEEVNRVILECRYSWEV